MVFTKILFDFAKCPSLGLTGPILTGSEDCLCVCGSQHSSLAFFVCLLDSSVRFAPESRGESSCVFHVYGRPSPWRTLRKCFLYWIWGENGTERERFCCAAAWHLDLNLPPWRCNTVGMRADPDTRLLGFKPLLHLWRTEWSWATYLTSLETLFSLIKWRCNRTYFTRLLQRVNEGTMRVKTLAHCWHQKMLLMMLQLRNHHLTIYWVNWIAQRLGHPCAFSAMCQVNSSEIALVEHLLLFWLMCLCLQVH